MPYFARNKSLPIFYLDEGPRTPTATILLITGFGCDMHDWSWQVPFLLSLNLRVISADNRGHGRSAAPKPTARTRQPPGSWPGPEASADPAVVDYYPQSTALDMVALLDQLDVRSNLIVAAHSMGDCVGYHIATSRPDLVVASIGVDPLHAFPNSLRDMKDAFFDNPSAALPLVIDHFAQNLYGPACPAWQKTWHLRRMAQLDPDVTFAVCWGAWGDAEDSLGRRENSVKAFGGRLKCPRLTLGSSDWYVETDREHMPKGDEELDEIVLMPGKGHWFFQLESEKFNAHLERWLGKIGVLPVGVTAAA